MPEEDSLGEEKEPKKMNEKNLVERKRNKAQKKQADKEETVLQRTD